MHNMTTTAQTETSTIKYAAPINEHQTKTWRVGIQGPPGSGKTWAALTFPSPIVMDFDNKLGRHSERKDVLRIPFWNNAFVLKEFGTKYKTNSNKASIRDAAIKFLLTEAIKLDATQTLVFDSWTFFQDAIDMQHHDEPVLNRQNEVDSFKFWSRKIEYSDRVMLALKGLSCNVVVTFHETAERDSDGALTGLLKPLMQGSYCDKIAGNFSDFFRQAAIEVKTKDEKGKDTIGTGVFEYYWQIRAGKLFNAITSHEFQGNPPMIKADYAELVKTTQTPNT